jgi:hypothetical protein
MLGSDLAVISHRFRELDRAHELTDERERFGVGSFRGFSNAYPSAM